MLIQVKSKGRIFTLSGISGSGKSHLLKHVLATRDDFERLKTVTTRPMREGELNGVDKYFITLAEFEYLHKQKEFEAVKEIYGNMYTFFTKDIQKYSNGTNLISEYYYQDVPRFKIAYPATKSIYLLPRNIMRALDEIDRRGLDLKEKKKRKLDITSELAFIKTENGQQSFDKLIINTYDEQPLNEMSNFIASILTS